MSTPAPAPAVAMDTIQLPAALADPLREEQQRTWRARADFRAMCRASLYYLTKVVVCSMLPENLMTGEVFKDSCDEIQRCLEFHKRLLLEDPRRHAKSYRTSIAIPLWVAIQYLGADGQGAKDPRLGIPYDHPDEVARLRGYLARHKNIRGPDTRIVIASEKKERAGEWSTASAVHWEKNPLLRWGFPELCWDLLGFSFKRLEYGVWNKDGYTLPGRTNPADPNPFVRAVGIRGGSTGTSADIYLIDDLLNEESYESTTELAYRCAWIRSAPQSIENRQVDDPAGSAIIMVTNRWNLDDPNSVIHNEHPEWRVWRRHAWVCAVHGYGNCGRLRSDEEESCHPVMDRRTGKATPLWKERHPDLEAIRQQLGDRIYSIQWENSPTSTADLDSEKMLDFDMRISHDKGGARGWYVCIPEQRVRETGQITALREVVDVRSLVHVVSIDPAGADKESEARKRGLTARWCATWYAFDPPTARVFTCAIEAGHFDPDEAVERCYQLWVFACNAVGDRVPIICERVACQTLVGVALRLRAQQDRIMLPDVRDLAKPRGVAKDNYIRQRLGWRLGQRQLFVRVGLDLPRREVRHFPAGFFKDWMDTEAMAEEFFMERQGAAAGRGKARMDQRKARRRHYGQQLALARR